MKNRTDLINFLIHTYDLDSYLEIGVQNKVNFNKINLKDHKKICVDPDEIANADFITTSDIFFSHNEKTDSPMMFDIIFIDGLHHCDQVKRDFENSLRYLTPRGFIVLHDCIPTEEIYSKVPRETKIWNGDVYKFACSLFKYKNIGYLTLDFDYGCGVVWKKEGWEDEDEFISSTWMEHFTWQDFIEHGKNLLNVIDPPDSIDVILNTIDKKISQ